MSGKFNRIGLFAGGAVAALAMAGGVGWMAGARAADAPAAGAPAGAPAAAPAGPRTANFTPAVGPFTPCGPDSGKSIGILPSNFASAPGAAAAGGGGGGGGRGGGAGRAGAAGGAPGAAAAPGVAGAGRAGGAAQGAAGAGAAGAGRGGAAAGAAAGGAAGGAARATTTDPKILAAMAAAVDPRGGNGGQPDACNWADNTGFVSIFDGTMKGWKSDPRFWHVAKDTDGTPMLEGLSTATNPSGNQYLTYTGMKAHDFDFKVDMRLPNGGSGIQYRTQTGIQWRSFAGPAGVYDNNLMDTGPQADYWSGANQFTGQAYSENTPMGIESWRTEVVEQFGNDRSQKKLLGTIAPVDTVAGHVDPTGWNHYEIIARGPVLMHFINGQLMAVLIDDDPKSSNNLAGMFGFEIEQTTTVDMKNLYVKRLN